MNYKQPRPSRGSKKKTCKLKSLKEPRKFVSNLKKSKEENENWIAQCGDLQRLRNINLKNWRKLTGDKLLDSFQKLAQAALRAPPEVAFAVRSWPLLLPTFSLSLFSLLSFFVFFLRLLLSRLKKISPQYFGITRRYM